jgi:hypothetical protein
MPGGRLLRLPAQVTLSTWFLHLEFPGQELLWKVLSKNMEGSSRIACELLSQHFPELRITIKTSTNKKD